MENFNKLQLTVGSPKWDEHGVPEEARNTFAKAMLAFTLNDAHGFWLPPESKDGHCNPEEFVYSIAGRLSALSDFYEASTTQSPIEDMMVGALMWLEVDWSGFLTPDYFEGPADHIAKFGPSEDLIFFVTAQAPVAGYKMDLLVWFQLKNFTGGVAIECDGHAFHEKTKEQAASDKKRDRAILAAGFPVMRFTGSEIFKDTLSCVEQVKNVLRDILLRVSREGGLIQ